MIILSFVLFVHGSCNSVPFGPPPSCRPSCLPLSLPPKFLLEKRPTQGITEPLRIDPVPEEHETSPPIEVKGPFSSSLQPAWSIHSSIALLRPTRLRSLSFLSSLSGAHGFTPDLTRAFSFKWEPHLEQERSALIKTRRFLKQRYIHQGEPKWIES